MSDSEDLDEIRAQKREELASEAGTPGEPIKITDSEHFQEIITEHPVVLADFYADWCGPCKMIAPAIEELAEETDAAVAKVDVDAHPDLAQQYQVQGVPTLYIFVNGDAEDRMVGVQEKASLHEKITAHT